MMVKKAYLLFLFNFICLILFSQDTQELRTAYARQIIKDLTSEGMHGRGYVNNGDQLAASYVRSAFQKYGLKSFGSDYEQQFAFPVNTFPGAIQFTVRGYNRATKKYEVFEGKAGITMLVGASSPPIKGTYSIVVFDSTYAVSDEQFEKFKKQIKSRAVFILADDRYVTDKKKLEYFKKVKANYFSAEGIIEFTKKLTHTVSQQVSDFESIKLLSDSFNLNVSHLKRIKTQLEIESKFIPEHAAQNIIGYVSGSVYPDSFLVFSAHYDHLGQLGSSVFFPGANDNASGCAMLLNLARHYSLTANRPRYSIAFIAFAGEEAGLIGSNYYTQHPVFPLRNISFLLNMDIMGTGDEGITVVNGTLFKKEFEALKEINSSGNLLKEIKIRGKAANSDHYHFSENGVKAFFIYTMGGIKAYHDVYDKAETLPLTKFEELFQLITHFADYLQHDPEIKK
jgi:aminopeptidase YwaD